MATIVEIDQGADAAVTFLEPYAQSGAINFLLGSGASLPAIQVAGAIETELNALILNGDEAQADQKSLAFIEEIVAVHANLAGQNPTNDVTATSLNYRRFVETIDAILFARKSTILPRQATVFTTNYDLFLEREAGRLPGLLLNDGFNRSADLATPSAFIPERYFDRTYRSGSLYGRVSEIPAINLVKLHGSLSWRRASDALVLATDLPPNLPEAQANDPEAVTGYLAQCFLILPTLRKFHDTLMERVYYDLLRLFSKSMEQENALLVSFGFSFADEHILDLTRRSLRNPTAQLLIVSYDRPSVAGYQAKFADHRNVAILAPLAGETINFGRLNDILAGVLPRASQ